MSGTHDPDAIERIAEAMHKADEISWKNTDDTKTVADVAWSDMLDDIEYIPYEDISLGRNHYRVMAIAALDAIDALYEDGADE